MSKPISILTLRPDPPPRPRLCHPPTNRKREVPRQAGSEPEQPSTPRRRPAPHGRLRRHRLQNRQSGHVAHALPHRRPRVLWPRRAVPRAPAVGRGALAVADHGRAQDRAEWLQQLEQMVGGLQQLVAGGWEQLSVWRVGVLAGFGDLRREI